jgi:hypothetical protein
MSSGSFPRLSTRTGLIYAVSREQDDYGVQDPETGVYAYYWIAMDFRPGQMVWKKMAGAGAQFDSFYPALAMGPNQALYAGAYGGFMTARDTR